MYISGDIVFVPFPFTDMSGQKIRPALVVSSVAKDRDVVVLFITSKQKASKKYTVPVVPSLQNGIKVPSVVVCDKISTLDTKVMLGSVGSLESSLLSQVGDTLRIVLGI